MGSEGQKRDWTNVSERRSKIMTKHMVPMYQSLLDATEATAGMRLLDAGCGSGELSALALRRGCSVTGSDLATGMIEVCRTTPELAAGTFIEASTENLPFEDAQFDIVISSMSVHFCDDVGKAMHELHRVLKPGGRVGMSAPASPDLQVLIVFKVAMELVPDQAVDFARPMMFAADGTLAKLLAETGFRDISERVAEAPMRESAFEQLWEAEKTWTPVRKACDVVGEAEFLRVYQERLLRQTGTAAPTLLDLAYRVVVATKA